MLMKTPNVTSDVISVGMLNHESFQGNNTSFRDHLA